jgi:hypothetical protein
VLALGSQAQACMIDIIGMSFILMYKMMGLPVLYVPDTGGILRILTRHYSLPPSSYHHKIMRNRSPGVCRPRAFFQLAVISFS